MIWYEKLPDNCPPDDAEAPNSRTFYRLCKSNPTDSSDFCSQLHDNPTRRFAGISLCILKAVSIWDDRSKCAGLKKLKTQRDKLVVLIQLENDDGLILKTFGPNHFSWWRSNSFDPIISVPLNP